jgi:superfamily II DNA or RNA helicase
MSRGAQAFKQTDVTKAIKGARNAGLNVQRFEIDRSGKIVVIASNAILSGPADLPTADV